MSQCAAFEGQGAVWAGWTELLSRWSWDWFCTLTVRPEFFRVGTESLLKSFRRWLSVITASAAGSTDLRHKIRRHPARYLPHFVIAFERHKSQVLHAHALVQFRTPLLEPTYQEAAKQWSFLRGRCKLEAPRSDAVIRYVCKYVVKECGSRRDEYEVVLSDDIAAASVAVGIVPALPWTVGRPGGQILTPPVCAESENECWKGYKSNRETEAKMDRYVVQIEVDFESVSMMDARVEALRQFLRTWPGQRPRDIDVRVYKNDFEHKTPFREFTQCACVREGVPW